ncbi:hypothetical protein PG991_016296 [Apiospora marii]|uniref:Uncharacterized protein n=1 Tax=Apiospora marii TaxID=335849 RepID=A0ABR1QZW3_9PEZI
MGQPSKLKANKSIKNSTTHRNTHAASGAGGGYDLPNLGQATSDNNKGHGTYRGEHSMAVAGQDLPIYKMNNPHGSGAKHEAMEPPAYSTGYGAAKKPKWAP